jgi:hypothetical protein
MSAYNEIASEFKLTVTGDDKTELSFHTEPLSKYTNSVRERQQHGAVFLWTREGRPAVVGTLRSKLLPDKSLRRIAVEFHSLSTESIVARHDDKDMWHPRLPGIGFRLIPDAAPPADSSEKRLLQLRTLARQFTAEIVDNQERQLRLLPRPLYRYSGNDAGVVDGSLFAFVMAGDPELFLLIEAHRTKEGDRRWQFAAARFTNAALELRHEDTLVWNRPTVTPTDRNGSYFYNPQMTVRKSVIE